MSHGHGNHWEAIDGDTDRTIEELLPRAVQGGALHGQTEVDIAGDHGTTRREKVFGLSYGIGSLGFFSLIVSDSASETPQNVFASGYPLCREGVVHELTVTRVLPWEGGIEGVVEATLKERGTTVWFFDPYFYRSKGVYQVGRSCKVALAALAMRLEKPGEKASEFEINEGPLLAVERERALRENPRADPNKLTSMKFSIKGSSIYLPAPNYPDEGAFRGVAEEVSRFEVEGRGFRRIKTSLIKTEDSSVGLSGSMRPTPSSRAMRLKSATTWTA